MRGPRYPRLGQSAHMLLLRISNCAALLSMSESLLQRVASGEAAAMRQCIDVYGGLVWSIARRCSTTRWDAEDATQEIFLDIWRSASRFDATLGSDSLFIAIIARRRSIDRLRRANSEPRTDPLEVIDQPISCADPGDAGVISMEAEEALLALATLRPEYRQVLELSLLHDLTQVEIAKNLNIPLGTVKSFMRRGLEQVRTLLAINLPVAFATRARKPTHRSCVHSRQQHTVRNTVNARLIGEKM